MPTLTLLVVRCRDLEHSRRFYEALGLAFTPEQHGAGPFHYSTQLGTTVLELYPANAATSAIRVGFGVTDVIAAVDAVRAIGGRVDREPTADARTALVRDPDNNTVELTPA
jgi:lactoylglutathione lyase